ncbi:MAG: hydroxymethylpyrimidine/phosphomethylpyrimidine kinase [Bacteroidetes bacterium]|nr:MAG: hydroxymethylpyrimidine/phosphomethylpyrimidine kinase [Bacteroidota bacterium]
MPKERSCVLSVAGFDPSGGAGVLADIKTFEQHKVQGMGAVTGLTFQNDSEFEGVKWVDTAEIEKQIEILFRKFKFDFIKIGMIRDLEVLGKITSSRLQAQNPNVIWDPILKASAGFEIHKTIDKKKVIDICSSIYLITPNADEVKILTGENDEVKGAKELSQYCNVLLKGGHSEKNKAKDHLFTTEGKVFPFRPKKISPMGKHGSGCVLSSAITANLANGLSLQRACLRGKDYVTKFIMSNKSLLGHHKI